MNKTKYIVLTDLWHNGKYSEVGDIINAESWNSSRIADFCSYFAKYCGLKELRVLSKFL